MPAATKPRQNFFVSQFKSKWLDMHPRKMRLRTPPAKVAVCRHEIQTRVMLGFYMNAYSGSVYG